MGCGGAISMADLFLFLILGLTPLSEALRFDVQSDQTKCISEDIKLNSMAVGKYSVINPSENQPIPDSHKISVRVTSPYGNSIHHADHVDSGDFAFTSSEAGDYLACFWTLDHKPPATITIEFDWRTGVAAKDWTYVAKKGQIDVMELELKKLEDTVKSIHDEMFYLRERIGNVINIYTRQAYIKDWQVISTLIDSRDFPWWPHGEKVKAAYQWCGVRREDYLNSFSNDFLCGTISWRLRVRLTQLCCQKNLLSNFVLVYYLENSTV